VGIKFYNKAQNFMINSYKNNKYIISYIRLNDKVRNSMEKIPTNGGKLRMWAQFFLPNFLVEPGCGCITATLGENSSS